MLVTLLVTVITISMYNSFLALKYYIKDFFDYDSLLQLLPSYLLLNEIESSETLENIVDFHRK